MLLLSELYEPVRCPTMHLGFLQTYRCTVLPFSQGTCSLSTVHPDPGFRSCAYVQIQDGACSPAALPLCRGSPDLRACQLDEGCRISRGPVRPVRSASSSGQCKVYVVVFVSWNSIYFPLPTYAYLLPSVIYQPTYPIVSCQNTSKNDTFIEVYNLRRRVNQKNPLFYVIKHKIYSSI